MKLVLGPNLHEARRFARELGDGWEGRLFGQHTDQTFDFIFIIQSSRIKFLWHPETLRAYVWDTVKTMITPGNERNIRIL